MFSLGSSFDMLFVELLTTTNPDLEAGVELFNFFFSILMNVALVGMIIKMIVRALGRS